MTRPAASPMPHGGLTLRELRGPQELAATIPLAHAIWGQTDRPEDTVMLRVIQYVGGLVAGAVDAQGQIWAYLEALPTSTVGVQHSHRMGVHPACRQQRLGERLKHFQRQWCLERGITHVHWTFDPLLAVNAHLNIHRLGAVVRTYLPDQYGDMENISAGAASDRLEAVWHLNSPRVEAHLAGRADEAWPEGEAFHPLHADLPERLPRALAMGVPAQDYYALLRDDRALAVEWRRRTRPVFTRLFSEGYSLVDVDLARRQYLFTQEVVC
ncbi:GNAT family N-acetyltransferase [Deinococcus radiopugnans]|uniref:Chorismate synthase n=2 Tax=Deinococcus radiopugnans ATCC 19172 TaxID=585398 RepID=A0ABR6NLI2_9DEIO|nr:GNAT family N-acetyltransferase [Deinococcus radiopugnans]MBB6014898.1 chorismate synthase [Deinococcus radiopugnans ATCC 19172]